MLAEWCSALLNLMLIQVQFLRQSFLYTAQKQFDITFDPILHSVNVRGIVFETSSSVDISSRCNWGKLGHSRTLLGKLAFFGLLMSMNGKIQYD